MNWKEIQDKAREKLSPICKVCPVCNGVVCRGQMPGMGSVGTGASFINNFQALANYKLNLRTLHDVREPELSLEIFDYKLDQPVILGAVAGGKLNLNDCITEEELADNWLQGAQMGGVLGMTGDGPDPALYETGLNAARKYPGIAIPIIKPRPQKEILTKIKDAEKAGAIAVGIDVDAAALIHKNITGLTVEPKTLDQLKEIVESTRLPVILKGIMTVEDALIACEAGVAAIVVSNHGGRALDHCPGTAEVLPQIAGAVREKITVLIDGGIRTGLDVLKCLALGAHAVVVGRPPTIAAIGGGAEGIKVMLDNFKADLRKTMILTGTKDVKSVSREILYK
ncbi:MAG: 4-hydroxymandelate oxidase [Clostridia bacterium]|jgi:isopentenyl diphosphate isomerase/L-lactate dehydrogenase-like FMN-dependent dehydrogenase|nr:4-hydroxymandelate oxidase [Clostridia bacterium]MDN5322641.1 4-hydroxymandelate oxidase [Clostridia bacterium]